ncbi:head closure [Halomonas phage phiHAP-1]|uniref:Putative tail tube protein n=1 Tax=Halomonas phage phiHAP-1 (isolate -/Gulf of Mexico/-/2001) TaxID=1283337 RepID=B0ZSG9_BPHA1|nr:head closure [Halomonas phage phiHAP-1]ABY90389.1 putative tail tube protein [Halomonas phage phiHAP-1]
MSTERKRMIMGGTLNGWPLMHQLEEYTPIEITKVMELAQGGRFAPEQMATGLEKLECSVTLTGAGVELIIAQGIWPGDTVELDIRESQEDLEGNDYAVWHSVSGEVIKVESSPVKMKDKPNKVLHIAPIRSKQTENGVIIHDINLRTQYIDLGQGDIMAPHRRNILMP